MSQEPISTSAPEALVENPYALWDDRADPTVPTATRQIYEYIAGELGRKETGSVLRASAATYCPKRRWYQRQGFAGTMFTPRKLINFMLGDLMEMVMLYWIKQACVGDGKLYRAVEFGTKSGEFCINRGGTPRVVELYDQPTLTTRVPATTTDPELIVTAHADGFGQRQSDGQWELIEVKSAANWGFQDFKTGGPQDYLKQAHTVMASDECRAKAVCGVRYFYGRKETGHPWDRFYPFDPATWQAVAQEYRAVQAAAEMPAPISLVPEMKGRRPNIQPTGRSVAQFPCTYCPYLERCQGKHTVEWGKDQWGNMRPKFLFEPKGARV